MAMTKAEKAEMEALRVQAALRWPDSPPKPVDLVVAQEASGKRWLRLWRFNTSSLRVEMGVTDGFQNTWGEYTEEQVENRHRNGSRVSMSQGGGGPWFATEADALRALHYAVARDCAIRLANIAKRVEAADAKTTGATP